MSSDSVWTRIVLRPVSVPVAWLFLKLGFSANGVSYFSLLFSLGGGVLFGMGGFVAPLVGAIFFNIFSVLDCVDGSIARVTKSAGPWGGWADAVMGYVAYVAVFLSTGVYVFRISGDWRYLLLAALTSSADLLMRTAYQMYKNIEPERAHASVSLERLVAENIGITGFLMPALLVLHFTGGMAGLIFLNAFFYIGGSIFSIVKIARKEKNTNDFN
ncbi:MAG TPA: CDP-alcohol phosphatidyltransferase family protein [Sediminispirochaeta sp.]|nr:CDP-alcohol phosphatidyltransferase family protein [Sediminispirochaeta sp.]